MGPAACILTRGMRPLWTMASRGRFYSDNDASDLGRAFGLIVLVLIAYAQVCQMGFIWDDESHLTQNAVIVGRLGLKEIWTSVEAVYYPLVLTTFWSLHKVFGLNPLPYHLLNVAIHTANAVLFWRVLLLLNVRGAWLGAALWALHPVMVQSVAWVTELKNTESCFFYLLSIQCFLKYEGAGKFTGKSWRLFTLAVVSFALAITSKPSTVMLPVVLLLCLWWCKRTWQTRNGFELAPFFLMSLVAGAWTIWEQKFHSGANGLEWAQSWPERLIIAGRAIWFYLGKLCWPAPLIFIYPRWSIDSSRLVAYGPLAAAAIGLAILFIYRTTWLRPIFFAAIYFVTLLFPVLGLFNIYFFRYSFVSDHFQYLASMGPLALAGAGIASGLSVLDSKQRVAGAIARVACVALLVTLGTLTFHRTTSYKNVFTLYQNILDKNPSCWMAHYNLGIALRADGYSDQAIDHYRQAVALKPDYAEANYNLARLLAEKGALQDAVEHYRSALDVNPEDAEAHNNLGATFARMGRVEDAIIEYRKALEFEPDYADAVRNLGNALLRTGRTAEAIPCYEKGLQLRPGDSEAQTNLGNALAQTGRIDEAILQYQAALTTAPNNVTAQSNLAWLLATGGPTSIRNGGDALRLADRANQLSGGNEPVILRILAAAYAETGDFQNAVKIARRARQLAEVEKDSKIVGTLDKEIALYESGHPYHRAESQ